MPLDFRTLPKVDLHFHMEGAIPRDFLFGLWQKEDEWILRSEFDGYFNYGSFSDFISLWCTHQKKLFSNALPDEILPGVVASIGGELHSQNTVYVEAHFSPVDACFMRYGFPGLLKHAGFYREVLMGWDRAVSSWHESYPAKTRFALILDLVRNYPEAVFDFQIEQLEQVASEAKNIIGVGLGGGNDGKSLLEFRDGFSRASNLGFALFAHAGEHGPPSVAVQEVLDAVDLGVKRIGHGIHALKSKEVLNLLKTRDIALEICPSSNQMIGTLARIIDLPVPSLLEQEIPFCLGSDDPSYFGASLAEQYALVQSWFALDDQVMVKLLENSYCYSMIPEEIMPQGLCEPDI